jgi:hypothetical protein
MSLLRWMNTTAVHSLSRILVIDFFKLIEKVICLKYTVCIHGNITMNLPELLIHAYMKIWGENFKKLAIKPQSHGRNLTSYCEVKKNNLRKW